MELPDRKDYSKHIIDAETGEVRQVHDSRGAEIPDPVPMAPPLGYTKPLSMFDQMRAQIRAEHVRLRNMELERLQETPQQANDFDVDEDIENMPSLYEERFDPVDFEARSRLRQKEFADSVAKRENELSPKQPELLDGRSLDTREISGRSDDTRGVDDGGVRPRSGGSLRDGERDEPRREESSRKGSSGRVRPGEERRGQVDNED